MEESVSGWLFPEIGEELDCLAVGGEVVQVPMDCDGKKSAVDNMMGKSRG